MKRKKKSMFKKLIMPTIFLLLSVGMFLFSKVDLCEKCEGFDPLCFLNRQWCLLKTKKYHTYLRLGSVVLFATSVIMFVRAGLRD